MTSIYIKTFEWKEGWFLLTKYLTHLSLWSLILMYFVWHNHLQLDRSMIVVVFWTNLAGWVLSSYLCLFFCCHSMATLGNEKGKVQHKGNLWIIQHEHLPSRIQNHSCMHGTLHMKSWAIYIVFMYVTEMCEKCHVLEVVTLTHIHYN